MPARSSLPVASLVVAIASALLGYAAGIATYGARVAVLETEVRDMVRTQDQMQSQLDRIADHIGAQPKTAALVPLPLTYRADRNVAFFAR